jgi:hypothetical protein
MEEVNADLDKWFDINVLNIPSYKHMLERKMDFMKLNKTERLMDQLPDRKAETIEKYVW